MPVQCLRSASTLHWKHGVAASVTVLATALGLAAAALVANRGDLPEKLAESLLVPVKAYPAISQKYGEVVCVAGIRTDPAAPAWVRMFPVAFRGIPFDQRFKKYQHISFGAERHSGATHV